MPYSQNSELPPPVKKLPSHAQDIFRSAFNAANTEYKDEKKAFATAWAAVEHAGYGAPGSDVKKAARIVKGTDVKKQILYCVVSEPNTEDLQGDVLDLDEIEKMAHNYLLDYRVVGDSHSKKRNGKVVKADAGIVESFIAPVDFQVGNETISKGSWVVAIKVNDPKLWAEVEKGDITGVSIGGTGERHGIEA